MNTQSRLRPALLLLALAAGSAPAETLLERGTYLMEGIVACGNCHTPKNADATEIEGMEYAGAFVIEEPGLKAYAPNITPDPETGIGSWSDKELIVAIRDGLRPDGSLIGPPMPSPYYAKMSDRDVRAIVAYLRNVKPIVNTVPKSEYEIPLPPNYGPRVETVAEVSRDDPVVYGDYVTNALGHCTECHTPMVKGVHQMDRIGEGGRIFPNIFGLGTIIVSRNITSHPDVGLGEWSDDEIKRAITEGVGRDGRSMAKGMAYAYYKRISDEDLDAIVAYLRSLPAMPPVN